MYPSLGDYTVFLAGFDSMKEAVDACGIFAVEVSLDREMSTGSMVSRDRFTIDSAATIASYADHLAGFGIKPVGFLLSNNLNAPDLDAETDWVSNAVKAAEALGMPAVRIDSIMSGDTDMTVPQRIERFVDGIGRVLAKTDGIDVDLGIENHGAGNNREFLDGVFDGVGSDRVGMTMDMGNFYAMGMPLSEVYETLEHLAPRAKHTHVKNVNYPEEVREQRRPPAWEYGKYACPIEEGDIDLTRVIGFLRAAGYDGDLSLENESYGRYPEHERKGVLVRDAVYLKSVL